MSFQPNGDLVVEFMNAKDRWFIAGACAAMTIVCLLLALFGGTVGLVVGIVGLIFFGVICLPYVVARAIRPGHALEVRADGFVANNFALDVGFVAWNEVASIDVETRGSLSSVVVRLVDPVALLRDRRPARRALLRLNHGAKRGIVRIPTTAFPVGAAALAEIMESRRGGVSG